MSAPETLTERVKGLAMAVGFDLAGVASAEPGADTERLRPWLAQGYDGEMHYIGRRVEERVDPRRVLVGTQSIVSLGFVYARPPIEDEAARGASFRVARYAGGDDYHDVLIERVRALEDGLEALAERPVASRGYVDTGPVLERTIAARAGLGWIGKNTLLIHPEVGSYLFLGAVLTDLPLEPDEAEADHCGSCRACLDACPTGAFPEPYVLDATRCISYTTIELRSEIPEALRGEHGAWGFGCDICQEVCPWNTRSRRSVPADVHGLRARIAPRPEWRNPSVAWVLGLEEEAWRGVTRRTALRRSKHRGLLRNALVVAGNSGDRSLVPSIERHAESPDEIVAAHARWALSALGGA